MKGFDILIVVLCIVLCDFTYGLKMIFPDLTVDSDAKTSTPTPSQEHLNDQLEFDGNNGYYQRRKYFLSDVLQGPENWERLSDEDYDYDIDEPAVELRLLPFVNILSAMDKILKDKTLLSVIIGNQHKRSQVSSQVGPSGAKSVSSLQRKYYRQEGDADFLTSQFPTFLDLTNTEYETSYQTPHRNLQKYAIPASKRNSGITPPSRDWCRLIGYRVCPRGMKTFLR